VRRPIVVEFTWSEAANLLVAAKSTNTRGWSRAAKGNLQRAIGKLLTHVRVEEDLNAMFLVVKAQTPVVERCPFMEQTERAERQCTRPIGHEGRCSFGAWVSR
jgi:hypothetical protein